MEFIVEEIEVKTDDDAECDPILQNDDGQTKSDGNMETSDPYFKFKHLVEELLVIFTKREEKCGICVEYIVKLCQHIGDVHDSDHEHESDPASKPSNFVSHTPILESRCISIQSMNPDDVSTSTTGTNGLGQGAETFTEANTIENVGFINEDIVVCDRQSNTPSAMKNKHKLNLKQLDHNSCEFCGMNFLHRYRLDRHLLIHTGEKPFECETCGKCFRREDTLREHKYMHTGEKIFKCNICDKVFCYSNSLRAHKRLVKCRQNSHGNPSNKVNDNIRNGILKLHKCLKCGKMFRNRHALSAHSKVHTGKSYQFYCGVCGKGFFDNYVLVRHKSTHTGEKRFHCGVCGKSFQYNSLLMRHKFSHMREKESSQHSASSTSLLKAHKSQSSSKGDKSQVNTVSNSIQPPELSPTGENGFNCDVCGKSFDYKSSLVRHKLTHTLETQVKCYKCGESFNDLRAFGVHKSENKCKRLRQHGMQRKRQMMSQLKCLTCGKLFQYMSHLNRHRVTHTRR